MPGTNTFAPVISEIVFDNKKPPGARCSRRLIHNGGCALRHRTPGALTFRLSLIADGLGFVAVGTKHTPHQFFHGQDIVMELPLRQAGFIGSRSGSHHSLGFFILGGKPDGWCYEEALEKFGDAVGWRKDGQWEWVNIIFDTSTPGGHLPLFIRWEVRGMFPLLSWEYWVRGGGVVLSHPDL
jgi:hypothetical protein